MPIFSRKGPRFEIEHRGIGRTSTCFPVDYDKSDLTEIMHSSSTWAQFYNTRTGEIVDCMDFYRQMMREMEDMDAV